MCLVILPNSKPEIADKDIIVYKSLHYDLTTIHQYFQYEYNKLYQTDIKLCPNNNDDAVPYDNKEIIAIANCFNKIKEYTHWSMLRELNKIYFIGQGFHSCKTLNRTDREYYPIFKCIIPKGSEYYTGIDSELLVSNQIIIKSLIE